MKKGLLALILFLNSLALLAQLPNGSIAPNWTATDLDGVQHTLYDYLDQGKSVFLEFSATWCGPCWNYHSTNILKNVYNQYGPSGTNQVMVFFIEADPNTNVACLYGPTGCNSSTQGNWVAGTPFPIIDDATGQLNASYNINYFPTLYAVCPDRKIYEVGQPPQSGWENWIQSCSLDEMHTSNDVVCVGTQNGSIDLMPTGGLPALSFQWSNGATTEDLFDIPAGNYFCTITESQGHSVEVGPINISGPSQPVAIQQTGQTNVDCFGNPTGSLSVSSSGGVPGYQYSWNNGQSSPILTNLPAGPYQLTVTDANGCTETATYQITQPPFLNLSISTVNENCSQGDGTLIALGSGGTPNYSYDIGEGPGPLPFFENLGAGTYMVTITDNNGCTNQATATLNNIPPPQANAGADTMITCDDPELTLEATASSGSTINYSWNSPNGGNVLSGANTLSPTVDTPGTYILEVTNTSSGCETLDTVEVLGQVEAPLIEIDTPDVLTCAVSEVILDASGSSEDTTLLITWTTQNGNFISGDTTLTPTVDAPGLYFLELMTPDSSCFSKDSVEVFIDTLAPSVELGPNLNLDCANPEETVLPEITGCGTLSYNLIDPNGCAQLSQDTLRFSTACSGGTVLLEVTCQQNGCVGEDDLTVNVNVEEPTAEAGSGEQLNCDPGQLQLDGAGSSEGSEFTYLWTTNEGNILSGENTLEPEVDQSGTYFIEVLNQSNGCSSLDSVSVNPAPQIGLELLSQTNLDCFGSQNGAAEVMGSGGAGALEYTWSNGETTTAISGLAAGSYTVTVTDPTSSCDNELQVTISQPDPLAANAQATGESDPGANDGAATAAPSGGTPGYSYAWSNGETTAAIQNLAPGNYTVTITDANNCTTQETVTVASAGCAFSAQTTTSPASCFGANDGSASVTVTGGQEPYTYEWSTGGESQTENNLAAGTYEVTVIDVSNCPAILQVTVTEPEAIAIEIAAQENVLCNGEASGSATVAASGGTGVLSYLWPSGQTGSTEENLAAGNYAVSVTDENGCESQLTVTVEEPAALELQVAVTGETSYEAMDGTADANPAGGTPGYSFEWSNGETTALIENLAPGTYCVTISDQNACLTEDCVEVEAFNCAINAKVEVEDVSCPGGADGSAGVEITAGSSPFNYAWSSGGNNPTENGLAAGEYTLTLTDANDCPATYTFTIEEPEPFALNTGITAVDCNGNASGSISVEVEGGTPGYTYEWSNGSTDTEISELEAGEYTLLLTDANDCTVETNYTVTEPDELLISPTSQEDVLCAGQATGSISVAGTGGTGMLSFQWSNGQSGPENTELPAGDYSVTLTDDNNCEATQSFTVSEPEPIAITVEEQLNVLCPTDTDGAATVSAEGGAGNYTYAWNTGSETATAENLSAGIYTVDITDENGCVQTLSVEIISEDDLAPQVATQDVTIFLDQNGNASLSVAQVDNGSTDNCSIASLALSQSEFGCADLGANAIELQAEDGSGNTGSAPATVTVEDILAPTITCPDDIEITDCSGIVNYDQPEAVDNCSATLNLTEGLASGQAFPLGTSQVSWEAVDPAGNKSECSFQVSVTNTLQSEIQDQNLSCFGEDNGTASIFAEGGDGNYSYEWDNGETGEEATNLAPGLHTVTVTDGTGCTSVAEVEIQENEEILLENVQVTNETGNNQNGAIQIEVMGGVAPFTYAWFFDGELVGNAMNLTSIGAGEYTLEITDANGCTFNEVIVVDRVTNTIDRELDQRVKLFPNPTTGKVILEISGLNGKDTRLEVWDLAGKQLYSKQDLSTRQEIDLSNLAVGIYVLKVQTGSQWTARKLTISK